MLSEGVYAGVVVGSQGGPDAGQGVITYTVQLNLERGVVNVPGVVSHQRIWPVNQRVNAWPLGTPLSFAVIGGRLFGLFHEPPALTSCA